MEDGEGSANGRSKMLPQTLVLDHVSPATRLLEKRRQMFEVQEALEAQKLDFNRKEEVFKRREEALKLKDLELQESLIRFSKFLQENDSKRARAEKKATDEIRARSQKEKEIEQLTEVLEELKSEKERILEVLEKNMRYQQYLESVLEVADEYQEVSDLLLRHATLSATNADLKDHQRRCSELAEKVRTELQIYVKQKTDEILNLNNQVAKLKTELEGYEAEAMVQEAKKDSSLQIASQRTLEYGQVVLSADNIFNRCRSKSSIGHPAESNPLHQLDVIGNFVSDLGAIIKQFRLEQAKRSQTRAED
ncbi:Cilia- and flagella-associated protein 73 [Pleodorina starrii]|uniref:Cilia- and flagella-associated protein 73 n=1 Tax=Pleodorina starrii TaxID=330485 RepID=A0A9W6F1W6_9CHLO|nr:Cilia- and flagella-associated protein 73 [Pleodorina starrii]GLC53219.1 Cilia- and flagella-associated protein 73 [Pleodorina starrii]